MENFLLLLICLTVGILLRRTKYFDERSPVVLNQLLVYFFIPILTLYHIPKLQFAFPQIWLSLTPFLIYGGSWLWGRLVARRFGVDRETEGTLIMCSGIGSISFVGFPVFELLYGKAGLVYGIILSLAGTFFVFNTVGISTGFYYSNTERQPFRFYLKKMLSFPPFIAFALASLFNFAKLSYPPLLDGTLKSLAAPFSVIALLTIGMQIEFSLAPNLRKAILIGQTYKLLLAPFLTYLLMWHILSVDPLLAKVCILGAAIGSMNAISIVAAQQGLNPRLAALMPAIGIPISIPLLFLIAWLLER